MTEKVDQYARTGFEIAVIGMAGRFPGADNIDGFWNNLKNGVESITFLTDKEIEEGGIPPEWLRNPNFVRSRGGVLESKKFFDATFFGYSPREAEIMDPQVRVLHECVWTALEDGGYNPDNYKGLIGLYAGSASNFKWEALSMVSGKSYEYGLYPASQLVDTGYLSTRVSYKLNLRGPSVTVQTACSTALVAIHMACRALISCECDLALAGGVSISSPMDRGYIYEEGLIFSADGHCRAFDIDASGTVIGDGAGIVVLKSHESAIEDNDHIYALIKGSAINNDGIRKVGFSAPSVEGQAEVIRAALHMAEVVPESIGYIEAHGTGTLLGDSVEVEALKLAFNTDKRGFCKIGSVKTNIGHLDRAAGVAGFIKTVLMLSHRQIPPTLNFTAPNPQIDLENSPFCICTELTEWRSDEYPLRAGVSSFGIGGTNAHLVLEEWTSAHLSYARDKEHGAWRTEGGSEFTHSSSDGRKYKLILLSAKTQSALERMTENLVNYLKENSVPGINLADVAYTLQLGRKAFKHRRVAACSDVQDAVQTLSSGDSNRVITSISKESDCPVIFMFPGQGAQYVNMGLELYQEEKTFREEMNRCFEIVKPLLGFDLKRVLYPLFFDPPNLVAGDPAGSCPEGAEIHSLKGVEPRIVEGREFGGSELVHQTRQSMETHHSDPINQTHITQPVIFAFEYALASLLLKWGIKPKAMIGHSIGEYVAACLAGVFSLEDALKLVVARGKLMQRLPEGAMLSVPLSEEELSPLLRDMELSIAAVNSSKQSVVSGSHEAVEAFAKELEEKGNESRRLHTSHAFHSQMMDPILVEFEAEVKKVKLDKPKIPYISNVSGNWINKSEVVNPGYWSKQIRQPVRFSDGLKKLLKEENALLVELGPGKALCTFVRQHNDKKPGQRTLNLVKHPKEEVSDHYYLLNRMGQFWLYGKAIDWAAFYAEERRFRISLPTYPFERQCYWIEGNPFKIGLEMMGSAASLQKKPDMADWYYVPSWERSMAEKHSTFVEGTPGPWLVFIDGCGIGARLIDSLEQEQADIILVRTGSDFKRISTREYTLGPAAPGDYDSLFRELKRDKKVPVHIAHFWSITGDNCQAPDLETIEGTQDTGLFSLLYIVQAIGRQGITTSIQMGVVTDGIQEVTGEEVLCPGKATLLGAVKIIPLEYPNIECKSIDITTAAAPFVIDLLLQELGSGYSRKIVAIRGNYCWVPAMKPFRLDETYKVCAPLKEGGVYLITGGMGGMGFTLADYLARSKTARLVLVGRSPFPPRSEWDNWLTAYGEKDQVSLKIQKIREWEKSGSEVMIVSADVSKLEQMEELVSQIKERFGPINGVLHTAGLADYEGVIQRRSRQMTEAVMAPKVKGTLVLDKVLMDMELDFLVLFSSIGNLLYKVKFGQVGYNAANEFLEAYACYRFREGKILTTAINWCDWQEVGMSEKAVRRRISPEEQNPNLESLLYGAVTPAEGVEVFNRILGSNLARVSVSTQDLDALIDRLKSEDSGGPGSWKTVAEAAFLTSCKLHERPDLSTEYAAPATEIEQALSEIWQRFFGIDRVGIHDDFFELGGDSLQVMTVASHIHKALSINIPIQVFFARPNIKKLAEYIGKGSDTTGYFSIEPAEKREYYSLSSAQKRIYILQQLDKNNITYNQPRLEPLQMEIDRGKIEETFWQLIQRHESLRTSFELVETEPVQVIHQLQDVDFVIEYYETQGRSPQEIIQDFVRSFDLCLAPLIRAGLIKVKDGEYILMVDLHHIISDGTSNALFIDEFIRLYNGEELPVLRLQYTDFSGWQNSQRGSGEIKKQEEYWLKEFSGDSLVLNLPLDYERPEVQSFAGDKIRFEIDRDELEKLREFEKLTDSTIFMVILAIYNIFLSKLTGQEKIVIGTTAAGRSHPDLENMIGMFVNTLALRNYPAGEKTFLDFLKELKERTLDAFDNQAYQFDDLVDKLLATRDTARNPIFDVMYAHRSEKVRPISSDSRVISEVGEEFFMESRSYSFEDYQSKFDLVLFSIEKVEQLIFLIIYSTKLFKRETIERFIKYFKEILSTVTKNRDIKLKDINISHDLREVKSTAYQGIESTFEFQGLVQE